MKKKSSVSHVHLKLCNPGRLQEKYLHTLSSWHSAKTAAHVLSSHKLSPYAMKKKNLLWGSGRARKGQTSWDVQQTSQWLRVVECHIIPDNNKCCVSCSLMCPPSWQCWLWRSSKKEMTSNERFVQKQILWERVASIVMFASSLARDIQSCLLPNDVSSSKACFAWLNLSSESVQYLWSWSGFHLHYHLK